METRELLSRAQRAGFSEITEDFSERDIVRYYTLSPEEIKVTNRHRCSHNRLGFAVH